MSSPADADISGPAPAPAHLASTLLSVEESQAGQSEDIWKTGISSLDRSLPTNIFAGGKVIGIYDSSIIADTPETRTVSLITQIITTHLASLQNAKRSSSGEAYVLSPAVYIIAPPTSISSESAVSPTTLSTVLAQASLPQSLLDHVSLLQYLDFAGLSSAVAEVVKTLTLTSLNQNQQQNQQQQQQQQQQQHYDHSHHPQKPLIILSSLPQTLISQHRTSGPTATLAQLSKLLRSITNLSRTHTHTAIFITDLTDTDIGTDTTYHPRNPYLLDNSQKAIINTFPSAFASHNPTPSSSSLPSSSSSVFHLLHSILDTTILVHSVQGQRVVEVTMDKHGPGTGTWGTCQ
jgi:hypothetical protein